MKTKEIGQHHGAGGRQSQDFINDLILKYLGNPILNRLDDAAVLENQKKGRLALTTDSYVVKPLFFQGGDIGRLAVSGTCNDLATSGAKPIALSLSFILEEGMPLEDLEKILLSIRKALNEAEVEVVTGDTKVVEKGKGDGLFINTAGIGVIEDGISLSTYNAKPGDIVAMTGAIGEHEVALMKERGLLPFEFEIKSDAAPLNIPLQQVLSLTKKLHVVKDPTRGGVAQAIHEIAHHSNVDIELDERSLPLSKEVKAVCELTGLDPLYMVNEGKFIVICPESEFLLLKEGFPQASIIGKVKERRGEKYSLALRAESGGLRKVAMMEVIQLPRIC